MIYLSWEQANNSREWPVQWTNYSWEELRETIIADGYYQAGGVGWAHFIHRGNDDILQICEITRLKDYGRYR